MKTRPKSVTLISSLFIILGALALIRRPFEMTNPAVSNMLAGSSLVLFQYVFSYLHAVVMITCGIAMLKAKNWGRHLYVVWGVLAILFGLATLPERLMLIPGVAVYAVFVFLLFRSGVSSYFDPAKPATG